MSSPSSVKINASSSRITRNTKHDINASRSRAFGASSISNSSRKVNGTTPGAGSHSARVYLEGVDVTPQSLLLSRIKPSTARDQRGGSKGKAGGGTTTRRSKNTRGSNSSSVVGASVVFSNTSASSIDDSSDTDTPIGGGKSSSTSSSTAGGHGKGSSSAAAAPIVPGASPVLSAPSAKKQMEDDDGGRNGPETDESGAPKSSLLGGESDRNMDMETSSPSTSTTAAAATAAATGGSSSQAAKTEKVRRCPITIQLAETPTMIVFELRSVCVSQDANYHQAVAARNRQYLEMCAQKKGSDKFVDGRSQTLQLAQKGKEVMTAPPATRDAMCVATDWDIFDCARIEEDNQNDHDENGGMDSTAASTNASSFSTTKQSRASTDYETGDLQLKHQVDEIVDATLVSPGCVLDVDGDIVEDLKARQHARTRRNKHHGAQHSHKSRTQYSSAAHSQLDAGRSSANAMRNTNNSSSSMASPSQSGASLSFGASQDVIGDSGNSSAQNSQVGGMSSSASHGGILSGESQSGGDDSSKQNAYARANTNVDIGETIAQQRTAKVLASQSLLQTVSIVERAVQQNVYHRQHVLYRNFPSLADAAGFPSKKDEARDWRSALGSSALGSSVSGDGGGNVNDVVPSFSNFSSGMGPRTGSGDKGGALEKLWAFQCELTANRRVSCLAWNTVNEDLLAVSYGRVEAPRPECSLGGAGSTGSTGGAFAVGGYTTASGVSPSPAAPGNASAAAALNHASGLPAETASEDDGLILFWSLKNPEYPERIYNLGVGVTSIEFSHTQPYLLAVGFANGVVAIYDTRKDDAQNSGNPAVGRGFGSSVVTSTTSVRQPPTLPGTSALKQLHTPVPIATSELSSGKHLDALWQVKWISKGSDRGENVVSIASDGRVTEWSMKKGLSYSDLMTLKRIANPLLGSDLSRADGVISRQASGHCIEFATNDPSVYFVGTEDGLIHKCSVSYNEQYLQTYLGHTGPVYQLLVSPFCSDLFLSCSGDWNIKLWHQSEQREVLNFRSVDLAHAVHGISWCPSDATIFGAVSEDGRIEIWDLQASTLDPIITHFPKKYYVPRSASAATSSGQGNSADADANADANALDGLVNGGGSAALAGNLDSLENPLTTTTSTYPHVGSKDSVSSESLSRQEIPLECTKIAFAPSAPIIVVGDSTGDVTVYRVPTLADGRRNEDMCVDEQVARLHKAMNPNKHE